MNFITEISHRVKTKTDTLIIERVVYSFLPKEKFVRRKDMKRKVSSKILAEYKIDVPFEIIETPKSRLVDYTHFHNDCEIVEWVEKKKHYRQPDLDNFIKEKLLIHNH